MRLCGMRRGKGGGSDGHKSARCRLARCFDMYRGLDVLRSREIALSCPVLRLSAESLNVSFHTGISCATLRQLFSWSLGTRLPLCSPISQSYLTSSPSRTRAVRKLVPSLRPAAQQEISLHSFTVFFCHYPSVHELPSFPHPSAYSIRLLHTSAVKRA